MSKASAMVSLEIAGVKTPGSDATPTRKTQWQSVRELHHDSAIFQASTLYGVVSNVHQILAH